MHGVSEGARPLGAHPDCRDIAQGWCGWPPAHPRTDHQVARSSRCGQSDAAGFIRLNGLRLKLRAAGINLGGARVSSPRLRGRWYPLGWFRVGAAYLLCPFPAQVVSMRHAGVGHSLAGIRIFVELRKRRFGHQARCESG